MFLIYNKNKNYIREILKETGNQSYVVLKVSYDSYKEKNLVFSLQFNDNLPIVDNINYGKVRKSEGFSKKIIEHIEEKEVKKTTDGFFISESELARIDNPFCFSPTVKIQEKLLDAYLKKINYENDSDNYKFLLKMPGIEINNLSFKKVIDFYNHYKENLNSAGISILHLNPKFAYVNTMYEVNKLEQIVKFMESTKLNENIIKASSSYLKESEVNEMIKYLLKDFITVVVNKINTDDNDNKNNLQSWFPHSTTIFDNIFRVLCKQFFEIYREDKDFEKKFESILSSSFCSSLISKNSTDIINTLNLKIQEIDSIFTVSHKKEVEYISINNDSFFKNIPKTLVEYFTDINSFLKLFKTSIENFSNTTLKDVLMSKNPSLTKEKDIIMILESNEQINKKDIESVVLKTLNHAVKCSSIDEIKMRVDDIAILVFKEILEDKIKVNEPSLNSKQNKITKF